MAKVLTPIPAQTTVETIGGLRIAFGLAWRFAPGLPGKSPEDEARQVSKDSKDPKRDFGVLIPHSPKALVGLASNSAKGAYAAAAIVATAQKRAIVVIRLGANRVWVARAGEGTLDPDVDLVVDDRRADQIIQEAMTQASAKGTQLDLVVGDNHDLKSQWLVGHPTLPAEVILKVGPAHSTAKVRRLNTLSRQQLLLIGAAILVPAAFALSEYRALEARKEAQRIALQEEALLRQQEADLASNGALREATMKSAVLAQLRKDTATPSPSESLQSCLAAYQRIGRHVGGWAVTTVACEPLGAGLTAQLAISHPAAPTFGTPSSLAKAAAALGGTASVAASLRDATLFLPLGERTARPAVDAIDALPAWSDLVNGAGSALLGRARGSRQFSYELSEPVPVEVTYTDPTAVSADGQPVLATAPPDATYQTASVVLTAPFLPGPVLAALETPNVRLLGIQWVPTLPQTTLNLSVLVKP